MVNKTPEASVYFVSLMSVLVAAMVFNLGCGKTTATPAAAASSLDGIPAIAPIVDSAAPTSLKASSSSYLDLTSLFNRGLDAITGIRSATASVTSATTTQIVDDLKVMFKGTYAMLSGGTAVGYMNAYLTDLDSRMAELKTRNISATVACMEAASQVYTVDASTVNASFKLALDVQCYDAFSGTGGDVSGAGSGMVWGKNTAGDYSLWLGLNHVSGTSGFGYAAKVLSPTSDADKTVDMIFIEGEAQYSRGTIARLKAKPSTKAYELVFLSNAGYSVSPQSGEQAHLGCGFGMISDGTYIYLKGAYLTAGSCTDAIAAEVCLKAADLTEASSATACNTLKTSFTITSTGNLDSLQSSVIPVPSTTELTLYNAIQIVNAKSKTTAL